MFVRLLKNTFFKNTGNQQKRSDAELDKLLVSAIAYAREDDNRAAIKIFKEYLQTRPFNAQVLNDLGVCLSNIGDEMEASRCFELAFSLDDSCIPAMVNHAKLLCEKGHTAEGVEFLKRARIANADFSHVDVVYASVEHRRGNAESARKLHLKAWLGNFDNLRTANGYLFQSTYDDISELEAASEHLFWASTLRTQEKIIKASDLVHEKRRGGKIRIGYWSPDFRNHSVRYFFRPLLEAHDREKTEIYLYYDGPAEDAQTALIRPRADYFFNVFDYSDEKLVGLMQSHDLDVLVELAGHSSYNRITLLQQRIARIHVTGLGYPPTTGLKNIDYKVLDRYISTAEDSKYYSESPLILPESFWCFDPLEPVPSAGTLPMLKDKAVTFGCVGNVAKISSRALKCWKAILKRVPKSKIQVRSINFKDLDSINGFKLKLLAAGIADERIEILPPAGGADFFESYSSIDIILDTFPFNGGTTTCFAVFMGVPVVSLQGKSVIGRMGRSILHNVDAAHLCVDTESQYVETAIRLSQDLAFLTKFRKNSRALMQASALGNGKRFAQHWEQALTHALKSSKSYSCSIPPLPESDILQRAYAVLRSGQSEACRRIILHCLDHYPLSVNAHILMAQCIKDGDDHLASAEYLVDRLESFVGNSKNSALLSIVQYFLLAGALDRAKFYLNLTAFHHAADETERLQIELYKKWFEESENSENTSPVKAEVFQDILLLVFSDDVNLFNEIRADIYEYVEFNPAFRIVIERCDENMRVERYRSLNAGPPDTVVVILHKTMRVRSRKFFSDVIAGLNNCEILGFAGATVWNDLDWSIESSSNKAGGYIKNLRNSNYKYELQLIGSSQRRLIPGMAVLDGKLLAFKPANVDFSIIDARLVGCEDLLEKTWTHELSMRGCHLAVHRNLGIFFDDAVELDKSNFIDARVLVAEQYNFDVMSLKHVDNTVLAVPARDEKNALGIASRYLTD